MEDRETARMRKYGVSKTTRITMATVLHVTSGLEPRKFQADGFLLTRVYVSKSWNWNCQSSLFSKEKSNYPDLLHIRMPGHPN